jgi:hypothetical protein
MLLLSMLLGILVVVVYAAGFVAIAWRVAVMRGLRSLLLAWPAGAVVFWLLNLAKLRVQGVPLHWPPVTAVDRLAIFGFLGYGFCGAGLATLSIARHLRGSSDRRLTLASTAAGIGAFFLGMLLTLAVVAINDLAGLIANFAR